MKTYILLKLVMDALSSIRRNLTPAIGGILLSFVAFLTLGFVISIYYNVGYNLDKIQKMPEIEVFMFSDATDADKEQLKNELEETSGVISLEFIDKDKAMERTKEIIGKDNELLDILGKDFLPESYIVDVDNEFEITDVIEKINGYTQVEYINYSIDEVKFINRISAWIRYLVMSAFIIALFFSYVMITSLIRITIYSKRKEIEIKRYLGAGNIFLMLPFIMEGVIISLVGALTAWGALLGVYMQISKRYATFFSGLSFNIFEIVPIGGFKFFVLFFIVITAVVFGSTSGYYAVWRHLKLGGVGIAAF